MKLDSKLGKFAAQGGFTLIEMLIVVAIIAILVAIAVPALNTAKTDAQASKEKSFLSAIGTAKTRAILAPNGDSLLGANTTFAGISPYLLINGTTPTSDGIRLATQNGTGKNLTTWGTYPNSSGTATVAAFGTAAAVTN